MTITHKPETYVYLSHSGYDSELTKRVEDFLQSHGYNVRKDFNRTFEEGADYKSAMQEIKSCDVFIALLSNEAQRFHEFDTEVSFACYLNYQNADNVFIPLMIEECDFTWDNRLFGRNIIDATIWTKDVETMIIQAIPDISREIVNCTNELNDADIRILSALQLLHEARQKKYIEPFNIAADLFRQALTELDDVQFDEIRLDITFELGIIQSLYGNPAEAIVLLKYSAKLAEKFDDFDTQIQSLIKKGWAYHRTNKYDEAMKCYEVAQKLCAKHDHRYGKGAVLNNIGEVYRSTGEYDNAMSFYRASIEANGVSDLEALGATWNNIGIIHMNRGEFAEAQDCVDKSLITFREDFEDAGESNALLTLGELHGLQGNFAQAIEALNNALEIKNRIGDEYCYGQTLLNLGNLSRLQGDFDKTQTYIENANEIFENLSDKGGKNSYYYYMGLLNNDLNKVEVAIECIVKALKISLSINDKLTLVRANLQLALIYKEKVKDYTKSLEYAKEAQVYTEKLQIPEDAKIKELIQQLNS